MDITYKNYLDMGNWIATNLEFSKRLGGIEFAFILAYLLKTKNDLEKNNTLKDGWFFVTKEKMFADTDIGIKTQDKVIKHLVAIGLIQSTNMGAPYRRYFRFSDNWFDIIQFAENIRYGSENINSTIPKGYSQLYQNGIVNYTKTEELTIPKGYSQLYQNGITNNIEYNNKEFNYKEYKIEKENIMQSQNFENSKNQIFEKSEPLAEDGNFQFTGGARAKNSGSRFAYSDSPNPIAGWDLANKLISFLNYDDDINREFKRKFLEAARKHVASIKGLNDDEAIKVLIEWYADHHFANNKNLNLQYNKFVSAASNYLIYYDGRKPKDNEATGLKSGIKTKYKGSGILARYDENGIPII